MIISVSSESTDMKSDAAPELCIAANERLTDKKTCDPSKDACSLPKELRDLPILITVRQAARILSCSEKHVRDLCREKQIVAGRCGTSWRINRDRMLTQFHLM